MERKSATANARLRYEQASPKHDDRFFYTYRFYALYCAGNSTTRIKTDSRNGHIHGISKFSTRAIPFFTHFYDLFYVDKVKTIPQNIDTLLTAVAVAF